MTKIYLLHPATFKLDGGAMFGIIPKPLWEKKITPDEFNRINMSLRLVLVQTPNKNILVDTGIGFHQGEKFNHQFAVKNSANDMEEFLQKHFQISTTDITDIIITHLHFDHVGGLGDKVATYPNATIHVHAKHLEYAQNPTARDSGSFHSHVFMPLINAYREKGKLKLVSGEEGQFEGLDISYKTSFGHTPYMIHPIVDHYIYMADLVPMGHHVNLPWVMGYDIEPGVTTIYKQKFYETIQQKNLTMIFEHDVDTWGGKIGVDDKGKYILVNPQPTQGKEVICLQ